LSMSVDRDVIAEGKSRARLSASGQRAIS